MTVKCKCPLGDLIWKMKLFYSILYRHFTLLVHIIMTLKFVSTSVCFFVCHMVSKLKYWPRKFPPIPDKQADNYIAKQDN